MLDIKYLQAYRMTFLGFQTLLKQLHMFLESQAKMFVWALLISKAAKIIL